MNHHSVFSNLSDRDKVDFYISLAVVILTGAFIIYYAFPAPVENNQNNILIENSLDISKLHIKDDVYVPVTNDILKRKKITPIKKIRPIQTPSHISSSKQVAPIFENSNSLTTKKEGTPKLEENASILEEMQKVNDTLNTTKIDNITANTIGQEIVTTKTIKEAPILKDVKEVINTNNDESSCIVVIGAFGRQSSKDKLLRRLENENYKIFKTPYKSLTRIGVYLPCDKVTIEKELIKLRKKYAKDAMLLIKDEN